MAIELSDEELKSLTSAIKNRYGIDFTNYEPKSLKRGFARLVLRHKLGSILGLWQKILNDRKYFISCIDDLTVNLTELFRNPEIWVKMHDDVLEELKTKMFLNIWHAGCSTGEEVYTMAIVLSDKGRLRTTKTLATDLSSTALAKAMEAKYSDVLVNKYVKSFQKYLPNGKVEDFFEREGDHWIVKNSFKKHIEFRQHNLVQDGMDREFDIIFCRNVMIYFDDTLKKQVMKLFYDALKPGGFFVIGYYDMLPAEEAKELFELYDSTTRIYRKR